MRGVTCSLAFTLVELLVVITIIVVLLALLTPALDQAVYQAELAVCGGNQHGIAAGALTYAMTFRRSYPTRAGIGAAERADNALSVGPRPNTLKYGSSSKLVIPFDDRSVLYGYLPLELMLCPLTAQIDLGDGANDTDTTIDATYNLWYGWRFRGARGMQKVGDRVVWGDQSFEFLSTDEDKIALGRFANNTHPDDAGRLANFRMQNQAPNDDTAITGDETVDGKWTISRWRLGGDHMRGATDMNFSKSDGSVGRLTAVKPQGDERMAIVPFESTNRSWPTIRIQLPDR